MKKSYPFLPGLLYLFVVLSLTSCMRFDDIQFEGIQNTNLGKLSVDESTLDMDLVFHNPNRIGGVLSRATGKAWIQDIYVGDFSTNKEVSIPARSNFTVPVRVSANLKEIFSNALTLMFKDSLQLRVEGNARMGKGALRRDIPIRYRGKKATLEWINQIR